MKILFIPAIKKIESYNMGNLKKLPKKLHILYSIQYKNLAEKIKKDLEKQNFKILGFEQVLGCSKIKPRAELLLIGSGKFHALNIAFSTSKQVYIYSCGKLEKISKQEIENFKIKQKTKLSKFYASDNIGLLVSTKPGQKFKDSEKLKKDLEKEFPNKNFHIFLSNIININELENFQIDFWINTACPGLELDSNNIINYEDI
ncbi:MAG: diphthamide synthesis protein [Nanoarchaeota archaeon]|nr:diphthamide synthesis protein [Nanoarchaeota archaeon]